MCISVCFGDAKVLHQIWLGDTPNFSLNAVEKYFSLPKPTRRAISPTRPGFNAFLGQGQLTSQAVCRPGSDDQCFLLCETKFCYSGSSKANEGVALSDPLDTYILFITGKNTPSGSCISLKDLSQLAQNQFFAQCSRFRAKQHPVYPVCKHGSTQIHLQLARFRRHFLLPHDAAPSIINDDLLLM